MSKVFPILFKQKYIQQIGTYPMMIQSKTRISKPLMNNTRYGLMVVRDFPCDYSAWNEPQRIHANIWLL